MIFTYVVLIVSAAITTLKGSYINNVWAFSYLIKRGIDMAKVWKDANEVIKMIHDLEDHRLRELDREMRKKPKFDKSIGGSGCNKNEKKKNKECI